MQTISRSEIREMLSQGANFKLVEALPEDFYESGHLPGAICLPSGDIAALAGQALPDKGQVIVVYCSGSICQNSIQAVAELECLGYADVRRYVDGKADWVSAGFPLEKSGDAAKEPGQCAGSGS